MTVMAASVVLNGATSSARVSAVTRSRILDAATRLNYRPNAVARGLTRRRMDSIGVVAKIHFGELNLYFLELLDGILEEASQHSQNVTVLAIQDWTDEARILRSLDGRVDGIILLGPSFLSPSFAAQLHESTPYVAIHGERPPSPAHNLEVDNEFGGYQITKHMIDMGHRRIAHFTGMLGLSGADQRHAGYQRALLDAGIAYDPKLVLDGLYSKPSGRRRAEELIKRRDESLPTAIFCANDAIAVGCIEVLQTHGLSVPKDISIGGFDGVPLTDTQIPSLTTVRQPFRQLGHRAVTYLLSQIRGETEDAGSDQACEVFAVELLIRETVACPPNCLIMPPPFIP